MHYTVDRYEGDIAVLIADDETELKVGSADLPDGTMEGSVLKLTEGGHFEPDMQMEESRRTRLARLKDKLLHGGDLG